MRIVAFIFACLAAHSLSAQKGQKIELVRADFQEFSAAIHPDAQRLLGDVVMRHEGVLMYCDSAYLYDKSNSLDAFGNVHIKQGDTLNLYGDRLEYRADTRTAEVFDNIRLTDREMILTTEYLIHDLETDVSTYLDGGKIVSTENDNVLTSRRGDYYSENKFFFFRDSVILNNAQYTIRTDSLRFDINSEIAYFIGPTEIESEESFIYCENGWSDTRNDISQFNKNAYIISDTQRMAGDSIFYDRNIGVGEAFQNVQISDTVNNYLINGHYAIHYDSVKQSLVTDRAVLTLIEGRDSLFLHGDSLFSFEDTLENPVVLAYHGVRFFRDDLQGKCDSLTYHRADSLIEMFSDPIIWSEENQISGRHITLFLKSGGLDRMLVEKDSFIASAADSAATQFNQIKGNNLTGFFNAGDLVKVDVRGNGETIYYAKEESENQPDKDIGMNKLICSDIIIHLDSNEVEKIIFIDMPSGTMFPIEQVPSGQNKLKGFRWDPASRPLRREDIFLDIVAPSSADETSAP